MKNKSGFTLIELMVVIVVIALLVTIATVTMNNVQQQARDSRRASNATTVAEALEKYFTKNGEYPSVPKMTSSNGSSVQTLLGLQNNNSLLAPNSALNTSNSWAAGGSGLPNSTTTMVYSGNTDSTASCTSGTTATDSCSDFKIQYYNEQDKTVTTVYSRHTSSTLAVLNPDAPTSAPNITATYTSPNVVASASTVSCPTGGTPQWSFQYRTNDGSWSSWSAYASSSTYTVAPTEGTKYGFQAKQQCYVSGGTSTDSPTSSEATYIRPVSTIPSAPAPYTTQSFRPYAVSGSICMDANGAGGAGTVIQIYGCNGSAAQDWSWNNNDGTIRPTYNMSLCITSNGHGPQLTLQNCDGSTIRKWTRADGGQFVNVSNGYCIDDSNWGTSNGNSIGTWDCTGATAQIWNMTDTQNAWTWPNVTCSATTTPQYQVNYQTTGLADSGWSNIGTSNRIVRTSVNQGYTYNTQVQARCVSAYASGSWSATGQANIQKAIVPPSTASNWSFGENASNRANITWWWTFSMSCGSGTNLYYQEDDWLSGPGNPVYWTAPRTPNGVGNVGWWTADSTGGAPYIIYGPNPTLKNTSSYYSSVGTPAPTSSVQTQSRAQGYCQNPTTGRTGPWSAWGTSPAAYI